MTTAAVSAPGVTDRASDDRPASTDGREFAPSSRGLTNAEAGERLMEARFARILLDSLAAFCEAAPRVKYDLHLALRNLQLSA